MTTLLGKDFMLYVNRLVQGDQMMVPVVCATSMTLTFNQDLKEATKPPDSRWRSYFVSMLGYSISLDGTYKYDEEGKSYSANEFVQNIILGEELIWFASDSKHPDHYYSGSILQNSISLTSPAEGPHTFSTALTGTGGITLTNPYGVFIYGLGPEQYIYNDGGFIIGYKSGGSMPPIVE